MDAKGTPKPKTPKSSAGEKLPLWLQLVPHQVHYIRSSFSKYIFLTAGFILVLTLAQGA